jgi:MFS transporter, NNP family, nitrate/nitrite transporter
MRVCVFVCVCLFVVVVGPYDTYTCGAHRWCFFIAFFIWFAIGPLIPFIRDDLNLTNDQIWTSSIAGVGGTITVRLILGPLCDKYGARTLFSIILIAASIPTACTGLIHTATDLMILRLCIGIAGGTFVMTEAWTSVMFSKEVVGTANAIVAGWGNLGASVTHILMGSLLLPFFRFLMNGDASKAWRWVSLVPASIGLLSGIGVYFFSDDCPRGNFQELEQNKSRTPGSAWKSWKSGSRHLSTHILAIQYACCFGVELTMNNATALYFENEFGQSSSTAGAIASVFGWMNLFARGFGGFFSDYANARSGMRGRLWIQVLLLVGEGITLFLFVQASTLGGAIASLCFFSLFVQSSEGATFGIVPYVDVEYTGTVSGIVGAGGNIGAVRTPKEKESSSESLGILI